MMPDNDLLLSVALDALASHGCPWTAPWPWCPQDPEGPRKRKVVPNFCGTCAGPGKSWTTKKRRACWERRVQEVADARNLGGTV